MPINLVEVVGVGQTWSVGASAVGAVQAGAGVCEELTAVVQVGGCGYRGVELRVGRRRGWRQGSLQREEPNAIAVGRAAVSALPPEDGDVLIALELEKPRRASSGRRRFGTPRGALRGVEGHQAAVAAAGDRCHRAAITGLAPSLAQTSLLVFMSSAAKMPVSPSGNSPKTLPE